jgi:ribonuclease BN (tRNA processing enzyme)
MAVMRINGIRTVLVLLGLCLVPAAFAAVCPPQKGIALQILGSGGPIADDARASSAYLVWIDGQSRVLIDAGGGTFLRFAQANADFRDLDFIGLSHFHADHSASLPALLKSGNFSNRTAALTIAGPAERGPFPGLNHFLANLLDKNSGAYAYLGGYLDGSAGLPELTAVEVADGDSSITRVFESEHGDLQIDALQVPHGIVPSLAFRIHVGEQTLVFASDQNGSNPEFVSFAKDATILLMHMPVPEGVTGVGRKLHAPPSVIGNIAHDANVDLLVLSHFMERSLRNLDQNVNRVRSEFSGPIEIGEDLACYCVEAQGK